MTNGQSYTSLPNVYAGPITDFRLDTIAVSSYSAAGDTFGDSLLAHGTVDNLVVTLPAAPNSKPDPRVQQRPLAGTIHQTEQLAIHARSYGKICFVD